MKSQIEKIKERRLITEFSEPGFTGKELLIGY